MKLLVVEDSDKNFQYICNALALAYPNWSIEFARSKSLSDYVRKINRISYDLIIFDIVIPRRDGETAYDLSLDLIQESINTPNENTRAVAITSMDTPEYDTLLRFNERMIPVLRRNDPSSLQAICDLIGDLRTASKVDFVLLCALESEACAFDFCDAKLGAWEMGLGASKKRAIAVDGHKGYLYVMPRTGLTSAALLTAKVIECYLPRFLIMPGICAGVAKECDFADVLVADMSWDYQVGKFTGDGFKIEPYQEPIDVKLLAQIKHICATTDLTHKLTQFVDAASKGLLKSKVLFGPIASGSAVVADQDKVTEIGLQQRKIIGIEMETSAVYFACRYSSKPPLFFSAKSVVDFADNEKSDVAHEFAARASAFFVTEVLKQLVLV